MGEYVWTDITIGGTIKRRDLPKLRKIIKQWQGENNSGYLEDFSPIDGQPIYFSGSYNYGQLPQEVTDEIQAIGLRWRFHSGECCGDGCGAIHRWTPERGRERCLADNDGPVIALSDLEDAMQSGRSLADVISDLQRFRVSFIPVQIIGD